MKKCILLALALAFSMAAHADNDCRGNCGSNGGGSTTNNPVANGGHGVGIGVGIAGANATGGNASVGDIRNTNTAAGGSVVGSGNANVSNRNDVNNANVGLNLQGQQQGQKQGQSQTTSNSNNAQQNVNVDASSNYEAARIPVATAYASSLIATNGTCFGSASGGIQGMGLGVTFGSTQFDENCDARYDSQELRAQGHIKAATARMCQKQANREAMEMAGTPCPGANKTASATGTTSYQSSTPMTTSMYTGDDPIVRKRLGLPPLK